MTPNEFRRAALSREGVIEAEHMGHPDFRFEGKIFASLGAPNDEWAMVKLPPDQQSSFASAAAELFIPCNGAWGRSGATLVHLSMAKDSATKSLVKAALEIAFENLAARTREKRTSKTSPEKQRSRAKVLRQKPLSTKQKRRS